MLFRDRVDQRVLVVTHGGTLRAFRFLLERWTFEDTVVHLRDDRTPNCSVTTYELDPEVRHLRLRDLNEVYWRGAEGISTGVGAVGPPRL